VCSQIGITVKCDVGKSLSQRPSHHWRPLLCFEGSVIFSSISGDQYEVRGDPLVTISSMSRILRRLQKAGVAHDFFQEGGGALLIWVDGASAGSCTLDIVSASEGFWSQIDKGNLEPNDVSCSKLLLASSERLWSSGSTSISSFARVANEVGQLLYQQIQVYLDSALPDCYLDSIESFQGSLKKLGSLI